MLQIGLGDQLFRGAAPHRVDTPASWPVLVAYLSITAADHHVTSLTGIDIELGAFSIVTPV
jgi:hypothetical protein